MRRSSGVHALALLAAVGVFAVQGPLLGLLPTSTALSTSASTAEVGQNVTYTASVTSLVARPSGRVSFTLGGAAIGSASLGGDGRAAVTTRLATGPTSRTVVARYEGALLFAGSSASLNQVVREPPPPPPSPSPVLPSPSPVPPSAGPAPAPRTPTDGSPPTSERPRAEPSRADPAGPQSPRSSDPTPARRGQRDEPAAQPGKSKPEQARTTPLRRLEPTQPPPSHLAVGGSAPSGDDADGVGALPRYVNSVPTPADVIITPERVVVTGLLAALILAYLAAVTTMFNQTLAQNYERIRAGSGRLARRIPWLARGSSHAEASRGLHLLEVGGYAGLCAVVLSVVNPDFGLNAKTLVTVVGFAIAVLIVTVTAGAPYALEVRSHLHQHPALKLRPAALPVGVLSAGVSRMVGFVPGFAYGMVAGYLTARSRQVIGAQRRGQLSAISATAVLCVSLAAWVAWAPVHEAVGDGNTGVVWLILDVALVSIFIVGLNGLAFELLPVEPFDGARLFGWDRRVWAVLQGLALVGLVLVLFNPRAGDVYLYNSSGLVGLLILLGGFGLFSLCFWAWFRIRPEAKGASGPAGGDLRTDPGIPPVPRHRRSEQHPAQ